MKLYGYWRSSTSFRVRIALNLKGVSYDVVPVNLAEGEQNGPAFLAINPMAGVPVLEQSPSKRLVNSPAILEWLEETHPRPSLLPGDAWKRARIRAAANVIMADTHAIQNLRVMMRLRDELGGDLGKAMGFIAHFIERNLATLETIIASEPDRAKFAFGDTPTLFECCLAPQFYSSGRFAPSLNLAERFPVLSAVMDAAMELEAFQRAHPDNQPDAPEA